MKNEMKRTGEMLLPAIAYGDAAGVPVETKSFHYIAENHGRMDHLIEATDNIYFKGEYPVGTTSDDTQLSVAVTKALLRSNGYDLRAIADEHIAAYHETPEYIMQSGRIKKLGWGASTADSVRRLIDGVSPRESGSKEGTGNGVLMKMAPLVYRQVAEGMDHRNRYSQYDELTSMTHDNDVARICTRVHGDVLAYLLTESYHPWNFVPDVIKMAEYHEKQFRTTWDVSNALLPLHDIAHGRRITEQMQAWSTRWAEQAGAQNDKEFGKSYGFYSPQTLALAYGAFIDGTYGGNRHPDYAETVYSAVNLGGDCDSTASIAGAMYNFAWKGDFELPEDAALLKNIDQLRDLSHKLSRQAMKVYTGSSVW
jgi:ADP-ribosylglycohydrolase